MYYGKSIPKFYNGYIEFLHEYLSYNTWAEILRDLEVFDDNCITDYNIFKSVADFACKNRLFGRIVVKSGGKYSSIEYYDLEFTLGDRLYFYMMQNWTYDLNKYIMSKINGNWVYISENKYTLMR